MSEGVLVVVSMLMGTVSTALVEVSKLIAKTKLGQALTGDVKLKAALVIAAIMAVVALLVTGELQVESIIVDVVALIQNPPGFWAFFPALGAIFSEIATAVGVVVAVSQGVYALLRKKLKEASWLAA